MADLIELAERCEMATGPDRRLDHEIYEELGLSGGRSVYRAPTYTASIDAALTLVPEGWGAEMYAHPGDCCARAYLLGEFEGENSPHRPTLLDSDYCIAKTVALALCCVALRARALSPGSSPDRAETGTGSGPEGTRAG